MIKTKVTFSEGRLFSGQSELFGYFLNCPDLLDKSRPSNSAATKKHTMVGQKYFKGEQTSVGGTKIY